MKKNKTQKTTLESCLTQQNVSQKQICYTLSMRNKFLSQFAQQYAQKKLKVQDVLDKSLKDYKNWKPEDVEKIFFSLYSIEKSFFSLYSI